MIRDHTLPLPAPTRPPPALAGPGDALAHAGAARQRPFALATPHVRVSGCELSGVAAVAADAWPLLVDLRSDAGACASVVIAPSEIRRELGGAAGTVLETVVAGDRTSGAVAEWRPTAPAAAPEIVLRWSVPVRGAVGAWADDDPEAWRAEGPLLGVRRRLTPRAAGHLLFQVTPSPEWSVTPAEGALHVEARVSLSAGGHATLLAAAGHDFSGAAGALTALSATAALEARAERSAEELRRERLALETGVRELDDALPWAAVRLRGPWTRSEEDPREPPPAARGRLLQKEAEPAWCGLGALAAGEWTAARRATEGPLHHPLRALLLGWLVAWSGRPERFEERRIDVLQAAAGVDPASLAAAERVTWRAALDAWIEAAESLGDPPWSEALRARRETLDEARTESGGGLRLPVVGRTATEDPSDDEAALMAAVVGGIEATRYRPPAAAPASAPERALRAWAAYATGRPEEGFRLLRSHLGAAFEDVQGAWAAGPDHPCRDHAASAALAPAATLFGMLGARAEAWYGRLRLAPRLPAHWTRLGVSGLLVGDARVALRYARGDEGHTFAVRQVGGRVPLTLVFEPEVPSEGPVRVRVDGAPADVGSEPVGERVRVRLQLPLDREREIRVEPDDAGREGGSARG